MFAFVFLSLLTTFLLALLIKNQVKPTTKLKKLPLPSGPLALPLLGNLMWMNNSSSDLGPAIDKLSHQYGPIFTIQIGPSRVVFISDRFLAHEVLVEKGLNFSDRPPADEIMPVIIANEYSISNNSYGPFWRLFRRNLISQVLHPSRLKLFSPARASVLKSLIEKLRSDAQANGGKEIVVLERFRYAVFCLFFFMCFGQEPSEKTVREIREVQRKLFIDWERYNVFAFSPNIAKWVFSGRWKELQDLFRRRGNILVPLIKSRREKQEKASKEVGRGGKDGGFACYVDSLMAIVLPPEQGGRKLTDEQIVGFCWEFLTAGIDSTAMLLQIIMANLVKHQEIQSKLLEEIQKQGKEELLEEEDAGNMRYLTAIVMETFRRHSLQHFVLHHVAREEMEIAGYRIPKGTLVNFAASRMALDGKVWENPMEFLPERFVPAEGEEEVADLTGTREIKLMPFGVGRRICPGLGVTTMHLAYFVANLVKEFEWKKAGNGDVDLSEKTEFLIGMKNPLQAVLSTRLDTERS